MFEELMKSLPQTNADVRQVIRRLEAEIVQSSYDGTAWRVPQLEARMSVMEQFLEFSNLIEKIVIEYEGTQQ